MKIPNRRRLWNTLNRRTQIRFRPCVYGQKLTGITTKTIKKTSAQIFKSKCGSARSKFTRVWWFKGRYQSSWASRSTCAKRGSHRLAGLDKLVVRLVGQSDLPPEAALFTAEEDEKADAAVRKIKQTYQEHVSERASERGALEMLKRKKSGVAFW